MRSFDSTWEDINEKNLIHDFPLMPEKELKKRYGQSVVQRYKVKLGLKPKGSFGFFKQKKFTTSNRFDIFIDEPFVTARPKGFWLDFCLGMY